jgi:S-DNA-T family DNA segregation ATPase FtsK/SpoIIIE
MAAGCSLACAALLLGAFWPLAAGHQRKLAERARKEADAARRQAEERRWPELLGKAGCRGVTVTAVEETRAGRTLRLRLPLSGKVTFRKLERSAEVIETIGRLRDGAVRFERGEHAGEVLMHVAENDILAQTVPYPMDVSDLTVNRPFRIGLHEDGSDNEVLFRELCALIVGLRGSGKSNLLNVLIAQLGRCVDTVIFMIDQKGGRAAQPWVRPWLEGRCPRPVIDWIATTRDESERMLNAVLRAIDARAHSGSGGEKITPSAAQPAIILIIDEMAVIFGLAAAARTAGSSNAVLAGLGARIVQLGRSEAVDAILATQRGTVTMTGGGDLKSQCKLRIGLGVASEADARYIIPDDASVARMLPRLKHPGTGIVSAGDARIAPVKFDRLEPGQIDDIAARLGYVRPELDPVTMAALGEDYSQRWTAVRAGHIPGFQRAAVAQGARSASGDIDWEQQFSEMTAGLDIGPDEERPLHPARLRMLELLDKAGVMGMTPARLQSALAAEGNGVVRQTIQKWLAEEAGTGRLVRASHGRYKSNRGRP